MIPDEVMSWYLSLSIGDYTSWGRYAYETPADKLTCISPIDCKTAPPIGNWKRYGMIGKRTTWGLIK